MNGYGNNAPYGELFYKGSYIGKESPTLLAVDLLQQYRTPTYNTSTLDVKITTTEITNPVTSGALTKTTLLQQYEYGLING